MTKSHAARLEKLDTLACIKDKNSQPTFIHWLGHPWTEEEKTKAMREHPDQRLFFKSLRESVAYEDFVP